MELIRNIWQIARLYFFSERKFIAYLMLATVIVLEILTTYVLVKSAEYNVPVFNALESKEVDAFFDGLQKLAILFIILLIIAGLKAFVSLRLQLNWRQWFTENILDSWTEERSFYGIKVINKEGDNPDQRISQDINSFIKNIIEIGLQLLSSIMKLIAFIFVLWELSGIITIYGYNIYGYLVWCTLIYVIINTYIIHLIGKPLSELFFKQEKKEANFRYQMVRLRENAESIALYDAGDFENKNLKERFLLIYYNTKKIINKNIQIIIFQKWYESASKFFPYIIISPRYFAGMIKWGHMAQASLAFTHVKDSLSFLINLYTTIAELKACTNRLLNFIKSLDNWHECAKKNQLNHLISKDIKHLAIANLNINLPNGTNILKNANITFNSNYIIKGANGGGKSTLFRTIAGIWPYCTGQIEKPLNKKIMFIPQKSYMPFGVFKNILLYPKMNLVSKAKLQSYLKKLNMENFTERLDHYDEWARVLSGGEQQKIAFIRALLFQPDYLFLDEAMNALDSKSRNIVMELLQQQLKSTIIISIVHDDVLGNTTTKKHSNLTFYKV